ncbi:hypothetical protein [Alteromonas lipolytica]|uniref:hypothetical protein n=1 Tax=Alteromonas lipolytica TaxID=1856405 RepID=UPI0015868202|nr:hypothetical protein [Alteromonas lipolytica]
MKKQHVLISAFGIACASTGYLAAWLAESPGPTEHQPMVTVINEMPTGSVQ